MTGSHRDSSRNSGLAIRKSLFSSILFLSFVFAFSIILLSVQTSGAVAADTVQTQAAPTAPTAVATASVTEVKAFDTPNDHGTSVTIEWKTSIDDKPEPGRIAGYVILRGTSPEGPFEKVSTVAPRAEQYLDTSAKNDVKYYYKVGILSGGETISLSAAAGPAVSKQQWYNHTQSNLLVIALIVVGAIMFCIFQASRGKKMYIRKIAGVEAVEEAVGRATEMGKSILFVPGIQDMDNVQTIAGLTILASVGKLAAQYETKLEVPVSRALVMSVARETLRQSYLQAGRPDLYNDDYVYYVTDEQFGYVAAVDGVMVREKPATCFFMGAFFAESLILAETGNSIGAIQIAGTAMPTQLPFFVAACDYTLIGEELFAASAYLSGDEKMIASLRGQDIGKAIAMFFIVVGGVSVTLSSLTGNSSFLAVTTFIKRLFALSF